MPSNKEWLYSLEPHELTEWFDAEHVTQSDTAHQSSISEDSSDAFTDSRTQLEADINAWLESNVGVSIWLTDIREQVRGWLDRQAAITDRKLRDEFNMTCVSDDDRAAVLVQRALFDCVPISKKDLLAKRLLSIIESETRELQAKVNSLVAENGDLEWRCLHFERKADELQAELDKWNELTKSIKLPDYPPFTQFAPKDRDADSREKLEADVRQILHSAYMLAWMHGNENRRGSSFEKLHVEFYNLLDRQEAITQAQIYKRLPKQQVSQESFESVIDDMSTEIELLTSERDNLAKDLADSEDQLSAVRERFREVTSTILDAVHAIERTANKYWNE